MIVPPEKSPKSLLKFRLILFNDDERYFVFLIMSRTNLYIIITLYYKIWLAGKLAEIDSTSQHIFYIKVNEIGDIKWLDEN
tara:strand:- start:1127 stop:1369 length:243 start_codon:yes stop_codon:yes gene_type:complete